MTSFSIVLSGGKTFAEVPAAILVEAAHAAGENRPRNCKTSRCNTCKCKLLAGGTKPLRAEPGLIENAEAAGWILGCVRVPLSDVRVDVEDLDYVQMPAQKNVPSRVDAIERLADWCQAESYLPAGAPY